MFKKVLYFIIFLVTINIVFSENFQVQNLQFSNVGGNIKICSSCGWDYTGFNDNYQYLNYNNQIIRNWLTTTSCNLQYSSNTITANFDISGNKADVFNYLKSNGRTDILQNNLYMKTQVNYVLKKNGNNVDTDTKTVYVSPDGVSIPTVTKFTQSYLNGLGPGNYEVIVQSAKPIDTKCNFGNGIYSSQVLINQPIFSYSIKNNCQGPDGSLINHGSSKIYYQSSSVSHPNSCTSETRTCNDGTLSGSYQYSSCSGPTYSWRTGSWSSCSVSSVCTLWVNSILGNQNRDIWCESNDGQTVDDSYCSSNLKPISSQSCSKTCDFDSDNLGNLNDNCPSTYNPSQTDWNNDGVGDACDDSDNDQIMDSNDKCPLKPGIQSRFGCPVWNITVIKPNSNVEATQRYFDCGMEDTIIKIERFNGDVEYEKILDGFVYKNDWNEDYYSCINYYTHEVLATYKYKLYPSEEYDSIEDIYEDDEKTPEEKLELELKKGNKARYVFKSDNKTIFVSNNGTEEEITTPESSDTSKKIYIYKNGALDRTEKVDAKKIAIMAHKVKNLKDKGEAEQFVNNTFRLMEKFDIIKNITTDGTKTKVQIRLQDIPTGDQKNITVYQVVSKSIANNLSQIKIISDGGGTFFVKDKDPIIGWYFNDSGDGTGNIEYEVPGDNEGGEVIVTQEAILFNEGELVVNYRQDACSPDEVHLFDLDDLENSKVYEPGSGSLYKVCLAHLTENLYDETAYSNTKHFFNYTHNGNVSINNSLGFNMSVGASTQRNDIYWDMLIQETNPDGNYSCLGSVNSTNNSLFGDCGYTKNRIWVHLGEDLVPPHSNLSTGPLAHTVAVKLNADDNIGGSGLDKIEYCIDESNSCIPDIVINDYEKAFAVTCPNDWGCIKFVRYRAYDIAGNVEEINSYAVKVLDKGSSCQADCTAKPSPNRFLSECRNINSCQYKEVNGDDGEFVAQQCDLLTMGSYVKYNETHEIMCPMGPFRKSKFVADPLIIGDTGCEDMIENSFPVIIDGQSVLMKVYSCS